MRGRPSLVSIGSWPGTSIDSALDWAFQLDEPALPELPALGAEEEMIAAMLRDDARPRAAFWARVDRQRPGRAKTQTLGPVSAKVLARRGHPVLSRYAAEYLEMLALVRAEEDVKALRAVGTTPVIYLDEPLLFAAPGEAETLRSVVHELHREGAIVGLHSCGPMPWALVLPLGFDYISFDATRGAWPQPDPAALRRFRARGGRLVLGALSPLETPATVPLPSLRARFGSDVDLSFSCGLAGVSVSEVPGLIARLVSLREAWCRTAGPRTAT